MLKQYKIFAIIGLIIGIYIYGFTNGQNKCAQQIAIQTTEISNQQAKNKRETNAKVYRTSMRDIRDILRAKYTIAD